MLTSNHYICSSNVATLYPHEVENYCWWMWCSLWIDLFPHYFSEYLFTSSVLFLTIFLL